MVIRGIVFDMDDTLYDERDYVRSGFSAVARVAGRSDAEVAQLTAWLSVAFEAGVRGDTFDRLRAAFPDVAERCTTIELVEAYRAHVPDVRLAPGMPATLDALQRRGLRLGVLSDGPVASQSAKVAALGLERWFDPILLTEALGPAYQKPGTAGFEAIAMSWGMSGPELAYVADNPQKDFLAPRRLGWLTIRLSHPRQLRHELEAADDHHRPDTVIGAPDDFLRILSKPGRDRGLAPS
jgi:putative hydrolase of the HAD superfamily